MTSHLRQEVREVIAAADFTPGCDAWMRGHDLSFTKLLAERGLIGLTWPTALGGREESNVARLVVTEELLRAGAPVAAHWIADRQIGPAILRHGAAALQHELLPRIARGEVTFCLGMSESGSGSDLAAVRTRATLDGDVYRISGTKIWTSHAHRSTHIYVLARTTVSDQRHEGLTEFVVDLAAPEIQVRPIYDLAGEHHFNEVHFEDVLVPARQVIGAVGGGWKQVTEQLAFERGGMERVLSTYPLVEALLAGGQQEDATTLGGLLCRLHALRAMARGVAEAMDCGQAPTHQAALLKYLGNVFEGDVVEAAREAFGASPDAGVAGLEGLLAVGILAVPGTTLRGGATEVLLTMIGRGELEATGRRTPVAADEVRQAADQLLAGQPRQADPGQLAGLWQSVVALGWSGVAVPEEAGGSGGSLRDLAGLATSLGRHGQAVPVVETALAAVAIARSGRSVDCSRPATSALGSGAELTSGSSGVRIDGVLTRVPWGRHATTFVVVAQSDEGEVLVELSAGSPGLAVVDGRNLAGEPRDHLELHDVLVPPAAVLGGQAAVDEARRLASVTRSAAVLGALQTAAQEAVAHARTREQFGKPLAAFQAIAHSLARMAAERALLEAAVEDALTADDPAGWRAAAAAVVAARAATAVARAAHQVLGAMGTTREHDLHLATLRLWAWRDDQVSQRLLERRVGQAALLAGPDATWDWCVHETDTLDHSHRSPWRSA